MNADVNGATRIYGVIGHPVRHSLSPLMQNAAFQAAGEDAVYVAFDVAPAALDEALGGLAASGVAGVNVTVPHKEGAARWVRSLTPEAERAGAVNTIAFRDGSAEGHNTDGLGFVRAANQLVGSVAGKRVLLLGAGGAARGVGSALRDAGATLVLSNRTLAKVAGLAETWGAECVAWDTATLSATAERVDVVVNASSAGMHGVGDIPLDWRSLSARPAAIDLVYAPLETAFLKAAAAAGCPVQDGLAMLAAQGELAYQFWLGSLPPEGVMEKTLRARIARA